MTSFTLDLSGVTHLDTAGALLIRDISRAAQKQGVTPALIQPKSPGLQVFLTLVAGTAQDTPPPPPKAAFNGVALLSHIGLKTEQLALLGVDFLSFFGHIVWALGRLVPRPSSMNWRAMVAIMFRTGVQALPIVGVMSFVIGVILAYQGSFQLSKFGAEIFTVDLLGVSILREIGVLMAAIMVAGRSGSAFAAQIGTMKLREEIDAMATMGISPMGELVLPRIVALTLVMPLLVVYADFVGLAGGALMSLSLLDISLTMFSKELHSAVEFSTFWVGLSKAPVFGLLIGLIGCYEGWQVSGSAESVGTHTTRAVVESIFLIVIFDGIFSVLFSLFGV